MRGIIEDLSYHVFEEELSVIEESNEIFGKAQVNNSDSEERSQDKCLEQQSQYEKLKCEVISLLQHRIHESKYKDMYQKCQDIVEKAEERYALGQSLSPLRRLAK